MDFPLNYGLLQEAPPPMVERKQIRVGADFGQLHDFSTIACAEMRTVQRGRTRMQFVKRVMRTMTRMVDLSQELQVPIADEEYWFRSVERVPLGTKYQDVCQRICDIACSEQFIGHDVLLRIDFTGVGIAVGQMLEDELAQRRRGKEIDFRPCTFVHGEAYNIGLGRVGKGYLAGRLTVLFEQRLLHFLPKSGIAEALKEEIATYTRRMSEHGHEQFGAFGYDEHDDLLTACGLAVLEEERGSLELLDPEIATRLQNFLG